MTYLSNLSDEDKKLILDKKPDILEGVRLLSEVIEEQDNEDYGLLLVHYEPNPITLGITLRLNCACSDTMMESILAASMASDKRFKKIMMNAVETFKNMANG